MPADRHEIGWGKMLDLGKNGVDYGNTFTWGELEGSACSDLADAAVERYLIDATGNSFEAKTGKAICARCVVVDECREKAFSAPNLPKHGVIGGVAMTEITRARSWRRYEQGDRPDVPKGRRPSWLRRTEATELVESVLTAAELGDEL